MAYTVNKVARMSGVSVRTLHFYDEVGLLKPAYVAANGYRFYEEAQLLALQQILFYRELGFELKQIKEILRRPDFDRIAALGSHRKVLQKKQAHTAKLIETIDKTIEHLKGKKKMKSQQLFAGFNARKQAKYEKYLIDRYGEPMKERIAQSKVRVANWTQDDWIKAGGAFAAICTDLAKLLRQGLPAESPEAQKVIRRHYEWLKQFWKPNRASYAGHSQLIVDSDLRKAYEVYDTELPEFAALAMIAFADKEL